MKEDSKSQDTTVDSIPLRSKIDPGVAATQRVAARGPKARAGSRSVAADLPSVRRQIIHGDAHGIASAGSSDDGRLAPTVGSDLSFDARLQAVSILQLGCGRETAARYLGLSLEEFNRAADSDADFGLDLVRAEVAAELAHMRCVQLAAQDPKNWRTSVWWLEQMRPETYNRPTKR